MISIGLIWSLGSAARYGENSSLRNEQSKIFSTFICNTERGCTTSSPSWRFGSGSFEAFFEAVAPFQDAINPSTPSITISGATCANQWLQLMAADMESWKRGKRYHGLVFWRGDPTEAKLMELSPRRPRTILPIWLLGDKAEVRRPYWRIRLFQTFHLIDVKRDLHIAEWI